MANRIDKVFSVNRIRQSWLQQTDEARTAMTDQSHPAEYRSLMEAYALLTQQIQKRFSGERLEAMQHFVAELGQTLKQHMDTTATDEMPDTSPEAFDATIDALLNTIEDLAEAFALIESTRSGSG